MASLQASGSSAFWPLLLLLPAIPIAVLYSQYRPGHTQKESAAAGPSKSAQKKKKQAAKGKGKGKGNAVAPIPDAAPDAVPAPPPASAASSVPASAPKPASTSTPAPAPKAIPYPPEQPLPEAEESAITSAGQASAPSKSSKKNKRRKNKAATSPAEEKVRSSPSTQATTPASKTATVPDLQTDEHDGWQTTRAERKNRQRSQKVAAAAAAVAAASDVDHVSENGATTHSAAGSDHATDVEASNHLNVPSAAASKSNVGASQRVESTLPVNPAALPEDGPIDWGEDLVDSEGDWSAGATWPEDGGVPLLTEPSAPVETRADSTDEPSVSSNLLAPQTDSVSASASSSGPRQRAQKGTSSPSVAAELHPSEFFSAPPRTISPLPPVEPEWESVPTRGGGARATQPTNSDRPTPSQKSTSGTKDQLTSRFSSANVFSRLNAEGEA